MAEKTREWPFRPTITGMARNGIGAVASLGIGDPAITPLWFGESDMATPEIICAAAKQALDDGKTFYSFARGTPELRAAIPRWMQRAQGVTLNPERITVPGSAMMGVMIALQCVAEAGHNVVIVTPIWPNIFYATRALGAEPRFVPLALDSKAGRWGLDLARLFDACDANTAAIFVCSPGNPTGWVMPASDQKALLEFARKRRIALISDEVYGPLVIDRAAPTMAALAEDGDPVFIVHSFSKAWAMTGWRVGWLVHPISLAPHMSEMSNFNNTGAATFAQYGAVAALDHGDPVLAAMADRCRKGRAVVEDFLSQQNRIQWVRPEGAFYGFLRIEGLTDSLHFAQRLVTEHKVGVAPGIAFGAAGDALNDQHIRICFAQDAGRLHRALETLGAAAERLL